MAGTILHVFFGGGWARAGLVTAHTVAFRRIAVSSCSPSRAVCELKPCVGLTPPPSPSAQQVSRRRWQRRRMIALRQGAHARIDRRPTVIFNTVSFRSSIERNDWPRIGRLAGDVLCRFPVRLHVDRLSTAAGHRTSARLPSATAPSLARAPVVYANVPYAEQKRRTCRTPPPGK